jgi:hypothetical protein
MAFPNIDSYACRILVLLLVWQTIKCGKRQSMKNISIPPARLGPHHCYIATLYPYSVVTVDKFCQEMKAAFLERTKNIFP